MSAPKIVYTLTDEAPLLATYSLLPIIRAFAAAAGVDVESRDISLAGRILAQFPTHLQPNQQVVDDLAELGAAVHDPNANIIKLPNISASLPQLLAAIKELQAAGYAVPDYPQDPQTDAEREIRAKYDKVKGSAVNPVLRQGNSDRRAPASVKNYAKAHPHRMGEWSPKSKTTVMTMAEGDFFHNEQSVIIAKDDVLTIRERLSDGSVQVLRDGLQVHAGDVVDATFMSAAALDDFLKKTIKYARNHNLLYSAHLKATMMKVSDPIIFGHVVRAYFRPVFKKYGADLAAAGISANDGLASIIEKARSLPNGTEIINAIHRQIANGPDLAMVNSEQGITGLHVPSDIIIDASMPAMIRGGGKMWGPDGREHDTLAVIPDSSYAGVYQAVIDDHRKNGALDPAKIGSVPNVGLMAQAAEEYGSHDKTFEIAQPGTVEVVGSDGEVLLSSEVAAGDIWRACIATDAAIRNWVGLAVERARITGAPAVFWLDHARAHDANLIAKLEQYLPEHDTDGLEIHLMPPAEAAAFSLDRMRAGLDTISVTGNVLRDYNTDLFPILELGTSAKMLSVVPLMKGGGLFETGAGGSAPKHVQQLQAENYLRWDSLGEFFALAASFEHLARATGNAQAQLLADTLDRATATFLANDKSPTRRVGGIDNRGSHYYLARYWADELAKQTQDPQLAARFAPVAKALADNETKIVSELNAGQRSPADIGGYYRPDPAKATAVMRPSETENQIINSI